MLATSLIFLRSRSSGAKVGREHGLCLIAFCPEIGDSPRDAASNALEREFVEEGSAIGMAIAEPEGLHSLLRQPHDGTTEAGWSRLKLARRLKAVASPPLVG